VREKGADKWCKDRGLSETATKRVKRLVTEDYKGGSVDYRDYRKVKVEDRVPRSLEIPLTPPGFWDISTP